MVKLRSSFSLHALLLFLSAGTFLTFTFGDDSLGDITSGNQADFSTAGTDLGSNWRSLDWFGYYHPTSADWLYHMDHGWIYPMATSFDSIWFYIPTHGWLWTTQSVYPWTWFHTGQGWKYYFKQTRKWVTPVASSESNSQTKDSNNSWNGGGGFEDPGEYIRSAQQRMVVGKTSSSHPDSAFTAHPPVEDRDNLNGIANYLAVTGSRDGYTNNPAYADFLANNSNDTFFMGVHDSNRISVTHSGIPYNGCRLILRTEFGYAAGRPTFDSNSQDENPPGGVGEDNIVQEVYFKSFSVYKNDVLQRPRESNHAGNQFVNITSANSTLPAAATVAKAGNVLTFANVDIRTYLLPNFVVVQGTNRLNITSIDGVTTATTDSTVANFTAAAFSIDIACGSPDVDDCVFSPSNQLAVRGRSYTNAGVQGQGNNATWGLFCVKDALVNGAVVNNLFRDTTKNGGTEGNYWPEEHPLFSRFTEPGNAATPNFTTADGHLDFDGDGTPDIPTRSTYGYSIWSTQYIQPTAGVTTFLFQVQGFGAPRKSSAAWPCYDNDIGALSAGTTAGQLPVNALNRDGVGVARACVGLRPWNGTSLIEDNDEVLAERSYPFCLAEVGFDQPFPNATADHYLTLWETDEVIAPGDTFSVALSTVSHQKRSNFKFADMRYQLILMAKN